MGPKRRGPREEPPHDHRWRESEWSTGVRTGLVGWFRQHGRSLPWRQTRDPYAIWISEIMLQQTQVATVIPYYERFLERFPHVASLAAADIDEVLKLWEGLGYYRRARQMHAAAERIMEDHAGVFPGDFETVLGLPGIGRYTAGAILSFSADQRLPVVEANTIRLFSRLVGLRRPPSESASQALLWNVAEALLPPGRGTATLNQATMEVGSLVCTPKNPACGDCPVVSFCAAHAAGLQAEIPGKVKRIEYEDRTHWALIVSHEERFFLRVCPPDAHWAGMWDFPRFDVTDRRDPETSVLEQFEKAFGWPVALGDPVHVLKHGVTKYRITLHAHRAVPDLAAGLMREATPGEAALVRETSGLSEDREGEWGWFRLEELEALALNTSARKLVRELPGRLF